MNSHKLIVDPKVIQEDYKAIQEYPGERAQHYSLFYQMTRITRDKGALAQDDRLDALSIAVNYWVEKMAQDAQVMQQRHREQLLEEELRKFMEAAGGSPSKGLRWVRV
jgi:hypothetical protein